MLMLVIADDVEIKDRLSTVFSVMGYTIVQYTHPLKALDNLEELQPDVTLFNSSDYPRHWKLLITQLRETRDRQESVFVLLTAEDFDPEEADKAAFLGVNFLFPGDITNADEIMDLDRKISRYKAPPERSRVLTWIPDEQERVSFLFSHPEDFRMVSGRFTELSPAGGVFRPDDPADMYGLQAGGILEGGSLRAGHSILTISCRIVRNAGTLSLAFLDFDGNGFQTLLDEMSHHVVSV